MSVQGGLCPGVGSQSSGVSVQGSSLCPGGVVSFQGGLCPGGGLCARGVSVRETPLYGNVLAVRILLNAFLFDCEP